MNIKIKIIKIVGLYVMAGIATAAGAALWNNVLQNKIEFAIEKHKNRKNNKVIKIDKNNGEMNTDKVIKFDKNRKKNNKVIKIDKNNGEMNMGKVIIFNKNWSR